VVHYETIFFVQLSGDPPIAIVAVLQRHTLDRVTSRGLFLSRCRRLPAAVIAGAAYPCQPTHSLDRELALRPW
jgi:hypothetical protein